MKILPKRKFELSEKCTFVESCDPYGQLGFNKK